MQLLLSNLTYFWLTLAVLSAIAEVTQPLFAAAFVALAALVAAAVSTLGIRWEVQVLVFVFALLAGLFLLRPRVLRKLSGKQNLPSRTELLIGQKGRVTEAIDPLSGAGRVEVQGQDWAARASAPLAVGSIITVEGADGIVLEVTEG